MWEAIGVFRDGVPEGHVIPQDRTDPPHDAAQECWCSPTEGEEGVWHHHDRLRREGPADPEHE